MSMKSLTFYLFGRSLLSLEWYNSPDHEPGFGEFVEDTDPVEFGPAELDGDGISYSCGRCGEVLVAGLRRALTPRDEADLLTAHDCDAPDEGGRAATLR